MKRTATELLPTFRILERRNIMGRGDKRTRRGKIFAGSYGKTRPQGKKKTATAKETNNKSE